MGKLFSFLDNNYHWFSFLMVGLLVFLSYISISNHYAISEIQLNIENKNVQLEKIDNHSFIVKKDTISYPTNVDVYELYFNTKKEQLNLEKEILKLQSEILDTNAYRVKAILLFLFAIASIIAPFLVYFGFKKTAENTFIKKFTEFTGKSGKDIEYIFSTKIRNKNIRAESKIVVINKIGTKLPESFKACLKSFKTDISNDENFIEVENFIDILDLEAEMKKIKKADVVILENQVPQGIWKVEDYKKDYITFANEICKHSNLLYFGKDNFPSNEIKDINIQDRISFAKAPSQLYNNTSNLLKYLYVIGKLKHIESNA
ncbi:MAG: hypothetical protein AB8B78_02220 [Polaribacter sp.]